MTTRSRFPSGSAAVKLPKKVRKQAKKAIKAAASPFVRDFAAAAMAAAGRVRRERQRREAGERTDELHVRDANRHRRIEGRRGVPHRRDRRRCAASSKASRRACARPQAERGRRPQPDPQAKPPSRQAAEGGEAARSRPSRPKPSEGPGRAGAARRPALARRLGPPRSWPRIAPAGCGAVWTLT